MARRSRPRPAMQPSRYRDSAQGVNADLAHRGAVGEQTDVGRMNRSPAASERAMASRRRPGRRPPARRADLRSHRRHAGGRDHRRRSAQGRRRGRAAPSARISSHRPLPAITSRSSKAARPSCGTRAPGRRRPRPPRRSRRTTSSTAAPRRPDGVHLDGGVVRGITMWQRRPRARALKRHALGVVAAEAAITPAARSASPRRAMRL